MLNEVESMSGLEGLDEGLVQNQQSIWQELDDLQVNVVLAESVVHEGYDTNVGFVKLDELGFELSKVLVSCVEDILGQSQSLINVWQVGQVDHGTLEQPLVNHLVFALIEDERLHKIIDPFLEHENYPPLLFYRNFISYCAYVNGKRYSQFFP